MLRSDGHRDRCRLGAHRHQDGAGAAGAGQLRGGPARGTTSWGRGGATPGVGLRRSRGNLERPESDPAFFETLAAKSGARGTGDGALQRRLGAAALRASEAYAHATRFLREEYAAAAAERDAVGSERYTLWARAFLGTAIDLDETYRWAWDELHRIEDRMDTVAGRILPGEALPAVVHLLETDPTRSIDGVDAFRDWLQA